ncbi:MAG TPA: selenium-dependent molybdenum cofactor biosynthesis protein YqeB [Dehalococcoidia bacterium]|nr:selenium-dependent molybdenum cofactor biosynthesis protein YqeB [Dehalococcoidia bacterium]
MDLTELVVLIRGGGEMASGIAHRLVRCHFRVCIAELPQPLAVRRGVSFCEAVYEGEWDVEGITAQLAQGPEEMPSLWQRGRIPVLVDPEARVREVLRPQVLVDATMAKRNLGVRIDDAPLVVATGPGFVAGQDAHMVVETNRGHDLGRLILSGEAEPDTGVPGDIDGHTASRVLKAPQEGLFRARKAIGDPVRARETVALLEPQPAWPYGPSLGPQPARPYGPSLGPQPVVAAIDGVLRGLLHDGLWVEARTKVGDIDPRGSREHCFTISDKARAIAGGVLEGILLFYRC